MALISLRHVSKVYPKGTRPALHDINLDIDRGDFVFLVGASGSGKTTLLSLLLREEEATDGEIRVAGNDLRRISNRQVPQYRRTIGFVFQDYKLLNNKTVWQNVAFALEVIGTRRSAIKSLVPKVLETVGLTGKESSYPHELSGGEQQRVAIARAYVNHPQILLADEPTGNLDPTTSLGIMEVLDAINRTGTTVVMATHNEEIVNSMRKRVVELHGGSIVRDEEHGSYDSAVYFPDAEVTSKAHQALGSGTGSNAVTSGSGDSDLRFRPKSGVEAEVTQAIAIEAGTIASGAMNGDEGIARLAQSVHSGRTGRYGEAFAPLETTLTWGKGLNLDEVERFRSGEPAATDGESAGKSAEESSGAPSGESGETAAQSDQPPAPPTEAPAQSEEPLGEGVSEEPSKDETATPENGLLAPPAPPSAAPATQGARQTDAAGAQATASTAQVGKTIAQETSENRENPETGEIEADAETAGNGDATSRQNENEEDKQ
ncbi:cell division ATP-binding protein FtsE [Bifidobacterium callitrichos]|uniref:Cell division ATP-binding protein FtsE n=1 Tax=Bifidobacterium callitrichos TaxID=762209 RepID=A0A5M9ZEX3_9BIFI|nr:cell division ATP-binding protein FtsE [Bifidobacterium callitrichos]KAA8817654.1 cell division ATP-binding protein FtsE [Bifidobacterium callitrichos]